MKRKLLLAALCVVGALGMRAQTDVTSTYITNPSFETDGAITASGAALTITGWTQSDPGTQFNNTGCYDASTAIPTQGSDIKVTPSAGDYFLFFRRGWSKGSTYTFTSSSASTLPAGSYTLSVDYKMCGSYDNTETSTTAIAISAKNGDTTLGSGSGTVKNSISGGSTAFTYLNTATWSTATASFSIEEETSVNFVISLTVGDTRRSDFVVDNVKLLYTAISRPTAVSISSSLALTVGGTSTLTPTYTPADANTDTDITWTTSDATVATVADGVVTAVGPGTATITATTANSVSATCDVTVTDVTAAAAPSFYSEVAAGDFYIVNAATGKSMGMIKSGWGTQAGLADHGIPFTVALNNGTYTLDSHTYNSATDHFFNGTFVDQPSTILYITSLGNGKYSISTADGSAFVTANVNDNIVANTAPTANSVLAQWYFVSKANLESAMANATTANPVDATFYIQDPDFSRNHILQLVQNGKTTANPGNETYLWKYTTSNYHFKGGDNGNMCAETYQNGGGKIYQELTGVKNGKYLLRAQAFHNGTGVTSLYANDEKVEVKVLNANGEGTAASMTGASAAFSAGQYQNEVEVYVTDGNLTIGIENVASNWACFDNFELYYLGPTVGGEAEALPEADMTAGNWYYFDITVDGMYNLTTTTLSDIVYTTDGNTLIENESSVTDNFAQAENATLTAGRYYVKSASAQTLAVTAGTYAYNVGAATLSAADGAYTQASTYTVTFPAAATSDPDAFAALAASATATVNGNSVALTAVENGFSLDLGTLTENTDYVISIPAGVYGYAEESMNEAIDVTLHTPAVFDGEYCLYDATNKLFLGRGAAYGTEATADKYGIPFNLTTDATGVSSFNFVDNNQYLFIAANGVFTDNASTGWVIESTTDGYYVLNKEKSLYLTHASGGFGEYVTTNAAIASATVWTLMTTAERDAIIAAYPADNINNVITASGVSTTADAFATFLSENYNSEDVTSAVGTATFTGAVGDWTWTSYNRNQDGQPAYGTGFVEAWNATGAWSQTIAAANLPAGIYKVTVQGYERRCANDAATALNTAGYNVVSTFLSANGEQVRFTDWNDVDGKPTNTTGAVTAFTNDEAENEVFVYLDGNTDLTLTVKKPNYIWDCWIIWNNVTLTRYYQTEANMTVQAGKYGTFVAPFAVTIPAGITAYTVETVTDDNVTLTQKAEAGETLDAQTPVILKNTTEADKTETFYGTSLTDSETEVGEYLVGVYKANVDIPENSYVLQTDGGVQAFYKVGSGFKSSANRCYLTSNVTTGANVRSISFAGEATGIEAIGVLTSGNYDAIYTAGGAKVNSLQKGLNIVVKDGKSYKIFVK